MGRGAMIPARSEYPRIVSMLTPARLQVIFALVSLALIIVFDISVFIYRPYDGLVFDESGSPVVSSVDKNSPAEKAGVLPGDEFLAVDGAPVDRFLSRPMYQPGVKAGESVTYDVKRNGETISLTTTLGGFFDNGLFYGPLLGMIFLSIALWLIGVILCLFAQPEDTRARLAGLVWLLTGVAVASGGPAGASYFWGSGITMKILWAVLGFLLVTLHVYFPAASFSTSFNTRLEKLFVAVTVVVIIITILDDIVFKAYYGTYTGLNSIVYGFTLICGLASLGLLLRSSFLAGDADIKRQTRIILWGMALGFLPFLALTLLPLMFGVSYIYGEYTSLFLILIPLSYAYVINQRKLLKVDFIINRMVVFFVMGLMILITSFLTLALFSTVMKLPSSVPIAGSIMAVIAALPSAGLRDQANQWVSRALYGAYYDHASVAGSLSGRLAQTLDRNVLVSLLTDDLSRQMGIQRTALFLLVGDHLQQQDGDEKLTISLDDELCKLSLVAQAPVRAHNVWSALSGDSQEPWQGFSWGELFVPLIFERCLQGILILGRRTAGDIYSDQDMRIIATVAHQGALAAANVQLVEIQRGLLQQLVRAGEEERKQVVRELHDGVMQNLLFIKEIIRQNPEAAGHLGDVITTLRHIIKTHRPMNLDLGLHTALEDLVSNMRVLSGKDGPSIDWRSSGENIYLPDEDATAIYRIAQESINNAILHAHCQHILVSLARDERTLALTINDDGIGMLEHPVVDGQFGLISMRERANMIGAKLDIHSKQGEGTKVILEFKLC